MFLTTAAVLEMGACIGRTVSKTLLQKKLLHRWERWVLPCICISNLPEGYLTNMMCCLFPYTVCHRREMGMCVFMLSQGLVLLGTVVLDVGVWEGQLVLSSCFSQSALLWCVVMLLLSWSSLTSPCCQDVVSHQEFPSGLMLQWGSRGAAGQGAAVPAVLRLQQVGYSPKPWENREIRTI